MKLCRLLYLSYWSRLCHPWLHWRWHQDYGCIGGGITTTTTAACAALVSKTGCCALTAGTGACGCVLTCPDPPACAVCEVERRFNGTLETNSPAG
uniref:Secreted protein n=1 Tax=Romanomermis culicivorax TaxID=13658 RepID=A0A915KN44_ROMCU